MARKRANIEDEDELLRPAATVGEPLPIEVELSSVTLDEVVTISQIELAALRAELDKARLDVEPLRAQIAACQALADSPTYPATPFVQGDDGWSPAYESVLKLRYFAETLNVENDALRAAARQLPGGGVPPGGTGVRSELGFDAAAVRARAQVTYGLFAAEQRGVELPPWQELDPLTQSLYVQAVMDKLSGRPTNGNLFCEYVR